MRGFLRVTIRLLGLAVLLGLGALIAYVGYMAWFWNHAMKADGRDLPVNGDPRPLRKA